MRFLGYFGLLLAVVDCYQYLECRLADDQYNADM